ncbi:hypothetical protein Y1Q_0014782 [Alligator mississippiensis]|uniref:Uncharacterized protein n=1 Tax=Alligator mississippiensis TaxID=8496 RepID=A0A151M200_ALLMI|nr:hypothetical protein Y1Q_0014782 [Alligator mississippiensis]
MKEAEQALTMMHANVSRQCSSHEIRPNQSTAISSASVLADNFYQATAGRNAQNPSLHFPHLETWAAVKAARIA